MRFKLTKIILPEKVASRLTKLAEITGRSELILLEDALSLYLDFEAWQVLEIRQALNEADAGNFASTTEVSALFGRLKKSAS